MLIIGEKLNSAIPSVRQFINDKDVAAIQDLVQKQVDGGADYLDLNTAQCNEVEDMEWLVRTVQEVTDVPICLDSTEAATIKKGLETVKGDKSKVMINSLSFERNRIEGILPLVLEYNTPLIGLTVDDSGVPKTTSERLRLTEQLIEVLRKNNYNIDQLYIDPLVLPLAVDHNNAKIFFECLTEIKKQFGVKTVSGLSNISYNTPKRKIINRYFLAICMASDMDAAILDPIDEKIMTAVTTVDFLMGKDRFGKNYLKAYRKEKIVD